MKEMLGQELLWYPLAFLGISSPLSAINVDTVLYTWMSLAALALFIVLARYYLHFQYSLGGYCIRAAIKSLISLIEQTVGKFMYRYYLFSGSIFIFILSCNLIALIPTIEEPTKDLNTTLALGIVTFFYTQREIIRTHGTAHFLKEFLLPMDIVFPLNIIVGLVLLPLKLLGEAASIISLSFRLFGNIFGGSIIAGIFAQAISGSVLLQSIALVSGLGLLITSFFVIFEGFLQAFIFSILSLTTLAMATTTEEIGK